MKRIDYYATPQSWKVPKWMGVTLGVIFSAVAVMAATLIVRLSQPAHADTPPPVAKVEVPTPSQPTPVVTEPPVQTQAVAPARPSTVKHVKLHKKARMIRGAKAKSSAILARHDSREKRKQKDDLDRLLGL